MKGAFSASVKATALYTAGLAVSSKIEKETVWSVR